jgi:general secretion pathway protein G
MSDIKTQLKNTGFTLVELMVVIAVMAILSTLVITQISGSHEKAYFSRAQTELNTISSAAKAYALKYDVYPDDSPDAGIPSEIMEFVRTADGNEEWPNGPWPGSKYDYDAWDVDSDGKNETYQISIRFCSWTEYTSPGGAALCKSRAPEEPWATNFGSNDNSVYYCIKGYCRANEGASWNTPGYCINCANNQAVKLPTE